MQSESEARGDELERPAQGMNEGNVAIAPACSRHHIQATSPTTIRGLSYVRPLFPSDELSSAEHSLGNPVDWRRWAFGKLTWINDENSTGLLS
jgi:hypothetical protein